jgi:pimeloyl-ACP methyl ester carboxylesterase
MSRSSPLTVGHATQSTLMTALGPLAALSAGTAGPPVLLVPGFTGSKEDFGPILDPIAAAGLRCWAIDLPGQYESPGPDDPGAYRPEALGGWLRAAATALGAPVHLLGHSFGGLVARAAVIAAPAEFASLVLMSSGPSAIDGARRDRIEALAPLLETDGAAGVYAAMLAADAARADYRAPEPEVATFLRRRFLLGSPAMLAGMADALLGEPDRVAELAATDVPTLVLHGVDDDAWTPDVQRAMAARLGAGHVAVPAAAHSPAVENPAPTAAALITFWRRVMLAPVTRDD